jgi:rSAM/selenodomain-associated transferase 1
MKVAMANTSAVSCGIAVMAKASAAGRTKTRLSPPLTGEEAARFNTAFLKDIAENLLRAAREATLTGAMAYGPPGTDGFFRDHLPREIQLHEVWEPDFGLCLSKALEVQFEAGHTVAGVLNSDSPTLPSELLVQACEILGASDEHTVVIGPSNDGGYYFLGCRRVHLELFQGIAWSTERVFQQTLDQARSAGLRVHVLPEWYDVDDAAALRLLHGELFLGQPFSTSYTSSPARHSKALMAQLLAEAALGERLKADRRNEALAANASVAA